MTEPSARTSGGLTPRFENCGKMLIAGLSGRFGPEPGPNSSPVDALGSKYSAARPVRSIGRLTAFARTWMARAGSTISPASKSTVSGAVGRMDADDDRAAALRRFPA